MSVPAGANRWDWNSDAGVPDGIEGSVVSIGLVVVNVPLVVAT